jgi:hypothetical protein
MRVVLDNFLVHIDKLSLIVRLIMSKTGSEPERQITWFGSSLPILCSLLQVLIVPACLEARDSLPTNGTELFRALIEGAQLAQVHV